MAVTDAQKSSIEALQKFYSIVIGVAFAGGVVKFMESFDLWNWDREQSVSALLFVAFLSTIVPFYQGMERHLYEIHLMGHGIDESKGGRRVNILVDVFAFMIMSILLVALGNL